MGAVRAALVRGALPLQMDLGLDLRKRKRHRVRIAEAGQRVDPGASGIAEAEQLGDLVVGLAGSVVEGAADQGVGPGAVGGTGKVKMRVATGDDQGQGGWSASIPVEPTPCPMRLGQLRVPERSARSRTAWICPSRWLTAISGRPRAKASALA